MFELSPTLQKLVRQLNKVPYLASKNVYRVAMYFLNSSQEQVEQLCRTIIEAKEAIKPCEVCFNWTEGQALCSICTSTQRKKSTVCIVETWYDLYALERAGEFNGVYHVLGGSLCPLEGIGPENLTIEPLVKRLDGSITELIFATNATPEGEATASYIFSKIKHTGVAVSKLASGMPTGSSLEHMDRITLCKALSGRRPF